MKYEKTVTARHTLQALWRIGLAGPTQKALVVDALETRFRECIGEENASLVRTDLITAMGRLASAVVDPHIEARAGANSATRLMSLDIILSLGLITIWMIIDARQRHASFLPFVAVTALFGVAGPLAYLVMREQARRIQRVVAFVLLIAPSAVTLTTWPTADLRPRALRQPSAQAGERGRDLLLKVAK